MSTVASAPGRVLSTLNQDGSRRKLTPRPSRGRFWRARGVVAYGLIALFVVLPFVKIGGRPALLIDLGSRELDLFGLVFRPSDGAVLMLFGLSVVLAVFLVTALFGRVWCGWGCPQTVYMEWVFRPLERKLKSRPLRLAVFGVIAVVVGNVFLAYFVGVDQLAVWVRGSPVQHPTGFAIMAGVSALALADFAWFREQTCILACPYGRLQTVLLDRQSSIIGYDATRGEPRGKAGKRVDALRVVGDCVDCRACVATCPTGIDIRDGLQMECIGCAQCVDACDAIMDRLGRKRGLIRYSSQDELAGKPKRVLRARTLIYPALLVLVAGLLIRQVGDRPSAEIWALRVEGQTFTVLGDGRVSTPSPLRIENRAGAPRRYEITLVDAPELELLAPRAPVEIAAGASVVIPVMTLAPADAFRHGERAVTLRIADDASFTRDVRVTLLGPEAP